MRIFCPAIAVFCSCRSVSVLAGNAGWSQTSSGLAPAGRVVLRTGRANRGRAGGQGGGAARGEVVLGGVGDAGGADGAAPPPRRGAQDGRALWWGRAQYSVGADSVKK